MTRICPRPLSPPPSASSALSFSYPVAYHYPVSTLTRGIQGCPKTISLDKNIWHSTFEKSFQSSFFCRFVSVHFCNTLCQKCSPFSTTQQPENLFPIFLLLQLFSPLPNECQLFMPKDFLEPPCLTLLGVSLVLRERVEGGGKQITSTLPQFYCPLSPNS